MELEAPWDVIKAVESGSCVEFPTKISLCCSQLMMGKGSIGKICALTITCVIDSLLEFHDMILLCICTKGVASSQVHLDMGWYQFSSSKSDFNFVKYIVIDRLSLWRL